jgi:ABC-2 type transport system ATP-binding protein
METTNAVLERGADPTASVAAVAVDALTKRYGARAAVDQLSFHVPVGAVAGFIGPNGSGKTTTMAILTGLVSPTSGEAAVFGVPVTDRAAALARVGALIEGPAFYPGLTGAENLRVLSAVGGHDAGEIPALLDRVGLAHRGDSRFREYSHGMKQRLGVAGALIGDPELLILDEPTNGLDPAGIAEMRELVADLARDGRTVLVSSHLLAELEQVCDWLVMIADGRLLSAGPASEFTGLRAATIAVETDRPGELARLSAALDAQGLVSEREGDRLLVAVGDGEPRAISAIVNRTAARQEIVLVELHVRRASLEDRYLSMVNGGRA